MADITLYDLGSKQGQSWSGNVWRTRLLLNYKQLPYQTHFLEYPDLRPFLSSKGIPPGGEGTSAYTVPTLQIGDRYIMDSAAIATEVERLYPTPALPLETPAGTKLRSKLSAVSSAIDPIIKPQVPKTILNEASQEYFYSTRRERHGMPLEQLEAEHGGSAAWEKVDEACRDLAQTLRENGGPFVEGKEPVYADFVTVAFLEFAKRAGQHIFERLVGPYPELKALYEACKPWLARNDH
ncbi:MAG: hypothetical protein M1819_004050 [Sarea resinae]|nr:MAG: hypothetical protein M1819_004050 [Sarea resinae]